MRERGSRPHASTAGTCSLGTALAILRRKCILQRCQVVPANTSGLEVEAGHLLRAETRCAHGRTSGVDKKCLTSKWALKHQRQGYRTYFVSAVRLLANPAVAP